MKRFSTKQALLLSLLSMVICVSMLVGSTFAWFTDSATANVNAIKSGDLDVEIVKADGSELTGALKWVKAAGHENETILWEPGCQYNLEGFKIINKGNLAFKYKVVISGLTGDSRLLEVIKFTVKIGDAAPVALEDWDGKLLPAGAEKTEITKDADIGETAAITIIGEMDKNAGNDYKNLTLDGIVITVYATQMGYESDSTRPDYDDAATYYPVIDAAGLRDALKAGGNISIEADFTAEEAKTELEDRITIKVPTTINLNGTITVPGSLEASNNWAALYINADTTINAGNGGGIYCSDKTDASASFVGGPYVAHVNVAGGTVTVNGGTYYGGCTIFNVQSGTLIVNGGFFSVYPVDPDTANNTNGYRYTLNCIDANYKNGTANIIVKGGTFVNFDPSNNAAEGAGTNFVAEGYTVISETQANGDVWYTVVEGTTVSTSDELASAVKNGGTVVLNDDVTLSAPIAIPADKDVTINLNGKTVTATGNFVTVNAGAKLTISGGTVDSGRYVFNVNGGEVVVNGGNFTAQETACALFGGSKLTVNDGTFTSKDNAVIATNGSSADGCEITVNGGVFNGNITSAGYIACGIYVANKDTVNVNAGTFNVTDGVGILMRAGHTTVGKDVVINLTNTGKVTAGRIGDANIDITTPSYLVMDVRSGYPGATAGFTITNNSSYELIEYK